MDVLFAPVPVHGERILQARVPGFTFTESRHRRAVSWHAHDRATVVLGLDGAFEETFTGRAGVTTCARATALVRPAGEAHADRFGIDGARDLVVEVDHDRAAAVRPEVTVLESVSWHRGPVFEALARRMLQELSRPDAASPLALESLALELLAVTARLNTRGARGPVAPLWLRRVRDLLHDRFAEPGLQVRDLATAADVHPVSLARAFRRHFGRSPAEYLRRVRLEWAAAELASNGRSLAEIAAAAGFADQSHFARSFRIAFGLTPGAWRRARHPGKLRPHDE